uniref:Putative secreted protein n=1 Tax=Ixodes ricinus TaxID=34613 RepID=A0A6B0UIX8_IXORI
MKSKSLWVPMQKLPTILPLSMTFLLLVIQPASTRSTTPSLNISEWMPRSLWPFSTFSTASGMLPMPICRVAPLSTRFSAMFLPILTSTSVSWEGLCSGSFALCCTRASK